MYDIFESFHIASIYDCNKQLFIFIYNSYLVVVVH